MSTKKLAIDLANNVFRLHGEDVNGKPVMCKPVPRAKLAETIQNLPPCRIIMEACGSAHHWGRRFQAMGHIVHLIPAQHVKPFRMGSKNDANDARAICEAADRPNIHYVPVKTVDQQDKQMVHRVRSQLVAERTAAINQIRGLMGEYGIVMPESAMTIRKKLPVVLDDTSNGLTPIAREVFRDLYDRLTQMDERLACYEKLIRQVSRDSEACQRIEQVPGIGPVTATAVVAAVGDDAKDFKNGRQLAAWLGLVPGQYSTGGKERMLGITKRGDKYLRALLIHGARAVVKTAEGKTDRLSQWINRIRAKSGFNVAAARWPTKMPAFSGRCCTRRKTTVVRRLHEDEIRL